MNKKLQILTCMLIPMAAFGQLKSPDCAKVKNGHFFYHSKKVNLWSEIFRNDTMHMEVVKGTNDTLVYKIDWTEPCLFTMQLMKSNQHFEPGEEAFTKSYIAANRVLKVAKEYYTFEAIMTSKDYAKEYKFSDTVWYKIK